MERDPHISKLIREGGVELAPEGFTTKVMARLQTEPGKFTYKPLIGRTGKFLILLAVAAMLVLPIVFGGEPSDQGLLESLGISGWKLPQLSLNLDLGFLSDMKISVGVLAGILALFVLVLSDAGLHRRANLL